MRVLSALLLSLVGAASLPPPGPPSSLRVEPGVGAGPVRPTSTFESLQRRLGARGIARARLDRGEGEDEPGAILFPDPADSLSTAELSWADTISLTRPATLIISQPRTRWRLPLGITIGTSLETLARLNGRPFTFSGFDWDYGGQGADWQGGRLETVLGPTMRLGVRLAPSQRCAGALTPEQSKAIEGDVRLSSDLPPLRQACVTVVQLHIVMLPDGRRQARHRTRAAGTTSTSRPEHRRP